MTNYNVTIEEYREIANKVYLKEITWEEYEKYNIVLEIKPSHSNEFINNLINNTCTDTRQEQNRILYTGSFRGNYHYTMLENGFKYVSEWSNGHRDVYVSKSDKAIVTYCEGDISLSLHDTIEDYENEIDTCTKFYNVY